MLLHGRCREIPNLHNFRPTYIAPLCCVVREIAHLGHLATALILEIYHFATVPSCAKIVQIGYVATVLILEWRCFSNYNYKISSHNDINFYNILFYSFFKNLSPNCFVYYKMYFHLAIFLGASDQTRTGTPKRARILSPMCLPISPQRHFFKKDSF